MLSLSIHLLNVALRKEEEKKEAEAQALVEAWNDAYNIPKGDAKTTALHCVKHWDVLSVKLYVFSVLWPALQELDWTQETTTSRNMMYGEVYVPSWAQDRFERAGKDPESLTQNRDFFVEKEDIRDYISKYGLTATRAPPTPLDGRRRRNSKGNTTMEISMPPLPLPSTAATKRTKTVKNEDYDNDDESDAEVSEVRNTVLDLVRNWDSYSLVKYPWSSLWLGLQALHWQQLPVCKSYERSSHVFKVLMDFLCFLQDFFILK